jgi:hypothetical protein
MRRMPQEHGKILVTRALADAARLGFHLAHLPDHAIEAAA